MKRPDRALGWWHPPFGRGVAFALVAALAACGDAPGSPDPIDSGGDLDSGPVFPGLDTERDYGEPPDPEPWDVDRSPRPPYDGPVLLDGECANADDADFLLDVSLPLEMVRACDDACEPDDRLCLWGCLEGAFSTSEPCRECMVEQIDCVTETCAEACRLAGGGVASDACRACAGPSCDADFEFCAGIVARPDPQSVDQTCASAASQAALTSGGLAAAIESPCWGRCATSACVGACVVEEVGLGTTCADCVVTYAACARGCDACDVAPFSWECTQCASGGCVDALRACTGAEVFDDPAAPEPGRVTIANLSGSTVVSLVRESDGAPWVRGVPYGGRGSATVPAGTEGVWGVTAGSIGVPSDIAATVELTIRAGESRTLFALGAGEVSSLWIVPQSTPRSVPVWNGVTSGTAVRLVTEADSGAAARIGPGERGELSLAGQLQIDANDDGVFDRSLFLDGLGVAAVGLYTELASPIGVGLMVVSGSGDVSVYVP